MYTGITQGLSVSFEKRSENTPWGNRRRLAVTGTRSALVVRIEAADATTGFSEAAYLIVSLVLLAMQSI